jgi:hypothetical protein
VVEGQEGQLREGFGGHVEDLCDEKILIHVSRRTCGWNKKGEALPTLSWAVMLSNGIVHRFVPRLWYFTAPSGCEA